MLTILRTRPGLTTGMLLAALTVAACGGSPSGRHAPSAKARTSAAPTPAATRATTSAAPDAASAAARQWMQKFCSSPAAEAAMYTFFFKEAVEAQKPRLSELVNTKETIISTSNSFTGVMVNNAKQLAEATPPAAADAASARLYLLAVYHRLNQSLLSADKRLLAIPTGNVRQFMAAFTPATTALIAAIKRSRHEIDSNPILGPALNTLDCRIGANG